MQTQMEIGMKVFLHITGQRQKFKGKIFDQKCQDFFYACFSFRLSLRFDIDRRITKIGTNDRYHVYSTGLKSIHCQ